MAKKLKKLWYKRGTNRWRRAYINAIVTGNKEQMEFFSKECK